MQELSPLPRGGSYVLDPDPTVGSAAIGLWFRAPGAGYDNATPGISNLAATAAAVAPLASGKSLYALVHTVGGELNIQVYPDIIGIAAVVPATSARRIVAAMTAAYFAPSVDDTAVKTARANAAVLGVQERYESDATLHDLLFGQIFANGPEHYPPLPTSVAQLTSISTAQVSDFAKRAFRAENGVLTLTGNVDASSVAAVTDGSGSGSMDRPIDSTLAPAPASATSTGAVDGVGLAWIGPPIADEKAATALDFVADYLFREQTGVVERRRSTRRTATRSSSASSSRCTIPASCSLLSAAITKSRPSSACSRRSLRCSSRWTGKRSKRRAKHFSITLRPTPRRRSSARTISAGIASKEILRMRPATAMVRTSKPHAPSIRSTSPTPSAAYLGKPVVVDLVATTPQKESTP